MKTIDNMKLGVKLVGSFIIVALIAGIVGLIGITKINETDENYTDLYLNYGVAMADIADVSISYQRLRINLDNILMNTDRANRGQYIDKINTYDKRMEQSLNKFEESIQSDAINNQLLRLKEDLYKYSTIKEEMINLALNSQEDQALLLMRSSETEVLTDQINSSFDLLFEGKIVDGAQKSKEYSNGVNAAVFFMITVIAIAISTGLVFGLLMARNISNPAIKLAQVARKISDGDLDIEVNINRGDEIGELALAFKRMGEKLNEAFLNINIASEQVASGSSQISDSSIALSQGATEQASAIEQLTSSIDEIGSQTKINAENANNANSIAENAKENAIQGNAQMKEMLGAMDTINESSNNISKIIKAIDDIAFQTNILALNAAVEAARAGQYGRGFAVVAEEVRNLAARSANAAKETTAMIEDSIKKVEGGTKIANETADALNNIVQGISQVASLVGDITEASSQQAVGIEQITQGIVQISEVVQNNSATSEETAAASEELSAQAIALREQVAMFKLKTTNKAKIRVHSGDLKQQSLKTENKVSNNKLTEHYESQNEEGANGLKKIILSDHEFGKY